MWPVASVFAAPDFKDILRIWSLVNFESIFQKYLWFRSDFEKEYGVKTPLKFIEYQIFLQKIGQKRCGQSDDQKHPCDYVNPRLTVCYRLCHGQNSCLIGRFPSNQVNSKCIQNCLLTVFSSKNFRIVIEFRKNKFRFRKFRIVKIFEN